MPDGRIEVSRRKRRKETVRANLDAVNERLAREGHRQIDLVDAALVERYGLEDLATTRGPA
jgi:hypothetical protein